jgi:hypothetical protein
VFSWIDYLKIVIGRKALLSPDVTRIRLSSVTKIASNSSEWLRQKLMAPSFP